MGSWVCHKLKNEHNFGPRSLNYTICKLNFDIGLHRMHLSHQDQLAASFACCVSKQSNPHAFPSCPLLLKPKLVTCQASLSQEDQIITLRQSLGWLRPQAHPKAHRGWMVEAFLLWHRNKLVHRQLSQLVAQLRSLQAEPLSEESPGSTGLPSNLARWSRKAIAEAQ